MKGTWDTGPVAELASPMLLFMYIAVCFDKRSFPCISIFIFCHIFSVFPMKFFPVFSMNSFPVGCPVWISLGNAFYFNTYSGVWNAYHVRCSEQYHIQGTYFVLPNTAFPKLSWPENALWSPSFLYVTSLSSKAAYMYLSAFCRTYFEIAS